MSATIGQLLRSGQRDEQYMSELTNELNQLVRYWLGIRPWLRLRPHLHHSSQLLYYSVTTLSGLQTLGEEYVNIVQTDVNKLSVPSLLKRFVAIILQIFGPYLLSKVLAALRRRVEDQRIVLPSIVNNQQRRKCLMKAISIGQEIVEYIHKTHLIVFYLNGFYYHLSKRLTQIQYISLNRTDTQPLTIYRVLAYLSLTQLLVSSTLRISSLAKSLASSDRPIEQEIERTSKSSEQTISGRCSLCLEMRRSTSVSPCGHLFCWHCVHEWLQQKNECPICREALDSSRIVLLQNYH